ncbi:hypothetical protein GKIL_0866 [Gloeobacter kilaueensis JS1]|uniref:Uncharacterized protein n=1 Tax=Gloeobacter kilaueensis (strain ATCC BAA-2537 / CCAP 1431/1 / ULC 316 / JS1) TaxID=1183438 RepID=U5QDT1_GLOK1|nr:hypothetical protein GKIL_0866 [Gloeobacter kilaueensis JS1]
MRVQAEAIGGPERSRVYKAALRILERHPESTEARVFALEVGRFYYSYDRKGGVPTVYDEAAIANDIAARSGK